MRSRYKILLWLLSLFIFLFVLVYFLFKIAFLSFPDSEISFKSDAVKEEIFVYKNQYSIPQIISKNEADGYFMLGFMHSQDRLWQMEALRRQANGTLAEVLGREYIELDVFSRLIGFNRISEDVFTNLSEQSKAILKHYSDGINFFIEKNTKRLPFEFNLLDFKPSKWSPLDCIAIQRLFAFEESSSFWNDLAMTEIAEKIGVEKAKQLLPYYNLTAPFIFDEQSSIYQSLRIDSAQIKDTLPLSFKKTKEKEFALFKEKESEFANLNEKFFEIKEKYFTSNAIIGSAAWAAKNKKNKGAILVGDMHLALTLPPRLYQVHFTSSEFNLVGFSLPGTPLILSGRNDYISWAMSNAMVDDLDFYAEKTDSSNADYYYNSKNQKVKFKFIADTLKIKNQADSVFYIRLAGRSALISDLQNLAEIGAKNSKQNYSIAKKYLITFNWTGQYKSDEFLANNKILKSKNWYQLKAALNTWQVPAANFVFADIKGHIGDVPAGLLPLRESSCIPWLLNPGWQEQTNWAKSVKIQNLLTIANPKKQYLIAANNPISRKYTQFVTSYWDIPSRAIRGDSLLSKYENYSFSDAQNMLRDSYSPYSKEILQSTLPLLQKHNASFSTLEKNALLYLKYWDNILSPDQIAPTIYKTFLEKLISNTFQDELGSSFLAFTNTSHLHYAKILEIIHLEKSDWFDNKITNKVETKEDIVLKSFKDAIEELKRNYSEKIDNWKYYNLNSIKLKHSFSEMEFFKHAVESDRLSMSGDFSTINFLKIKNKFEAIGCAGRMICPMDEDCVYLSIPGGVSGQPLSGNFTDQIQLWLSAGFIEIPLSKEPALNYTLFIKAAPKK